MVFGGGPMIVKHRVAVLLADTSRAVQLAERLEKQGASAVLTTGSDDLYQAFNRDPIDLIVIEQQLAGFLSGMEIVERLFVDLLRPVTVLLGDLAPEEGKRAETIGVQCVLEATASLDEAASVVGRLLGQVSRSDDVIPAPARRIVQRADYIQPLPQLLLKLVGHLQNDDIDCARLVRDISVDPMIAADMLKYANSSALGRRQKTTKISDAVNYLGPRKAIGVAISTGMMRARGALLGDLPPALHHWHSSRAVLTACTAAAFAGRIERISEESAYILGLIQDLGVLVMARAFGDRYLEAVERVKRIAHLNLAHMERDVFGVTHAETSAALLRKWEMPASFVSLVLRHHDRDESEHAAADLRFLRAMQIGEAFSELHDNRSPQRYLSLRNLTDHYGAEAAAECRECLASAVTRMVESSEVFNLPAPQADVLHAMLKDLARQRSFQELMTEEEAAPPASPAETAPAPASAEPDAVAATILIIDDEPAVAKTIRLYLREWSYRVIACDNEADARRLSAEADLVLCDIHLGGENGIELVRELREEGYAGPIIIISGDGQRGTVLSSIKAGVNDYLLKPFSKTQLTEKLRKHLTAAAAPC